jgi:hypothetical protein
MGLFSNDQNAQSADTRLQYRQQEGSEILKEWVIGNVISDSQYEIDRVTKYHLFWKFYKGEHWRIFNDTFLSFNYTRAFVNKVISFLIGDKSFSLSVRNEDGEEIPDEIQKAAEAMCENQWRKNSKLLKIYEILQMGSITGDAWVQLQWLNDAKYVQINCLDSRYSFPEFENGDINRLAAFTVRQSLISNDNMYKIYCTRYTTTKIETWYQKSTSTKKETAKFEPTSSPNTYGFIPVVHIKNKPNASDYYGFSDMEDIMKLNKVYNEINQMIKGIVDYYAAPTTIVIGGNIKTMSKGIGQVWSGLPQGASVTNLTLGEDLGSTMQFLALIKQAMHELSDVPENALGKIQAISNTSAAALKITYQPLVQQADLKGITYSDGIEEMHHMMVRMIRKFDKGNKHLKILPTDFEANHRVYPVWTYGLPNDKMLQIQESSELLRNRLSSRDAEMNALGMRNVPKILDEIDADLRREGQVDAEVASMINGAEIDPNQGTGNG